MMVVIARYLAWLPLPVVLPAASSGALIEIDLVAVRQK
jgi:hypothetical protein